MTDEIPITGDDYANAMQYLRDLADGNPSAEEAVDVVLGVSHWALRLLRDQRADEKQEEEYREVFGVLIRDRCIRHSNSGSFVPIGIPGRSNRRTVVIKA